MLSSEQRHRTLLLMQLVSRRPIDRAEIARWATAMGWDMDGARAVVLVELCDGAGERVAVAGQPIEDRLVRAAQDAVSSQPIVWALRAGLALLVEPQPSLGRVARDLHAALRGPGGRGRDGGGGRRRRGRRARRSYEEAASTLALGRELSGRTASSSARSRRLPAAARLPLDELRRHRAEAIGPLLE